uniref:integrator complex subunit 14-like n=1 Tax=Styela clava TaxID=7725 RepID=UPI0019395D8C|nr:integrator complex subunit 14-like [Styela clava]
MPTIIAFDCSLSMSRVVTTQVGEEGGIKISQKHLAYDACNELLKYLSKRIKLEYTALLSFSSTCQVLCEFTRDHEALKAALNKAKLRDKACLEPLCHEINNLVSKEFGYMVPCNIIIVTNGRVNWTSDVRSVNPEESLQSIEFPIKFQSAIHFICVTEDLAKSGREKFIQAVIQTNNGKGTINNLQSPVIDHQLSVRKMVNDFTSKHMSVFTGRLQCGNLKNDIVLFPSPEKQKSSGDIGMNPLRSIEKDLHIVGFLNISDVKSPPASSRHLILPVGNTNITTTEDDKSPSQDLGNLPSFIVALHGSLKIEHKIALVLVGEDWYGIISSWTDHKKKSNLILSLFGIGTECIPWLGSLEHLGPSEGAPPIPTDKKHVASFAVASDPKSYSQNLVVWTKPTGLQTDVQKLLRSAKKLPEKTQVFYKDLNRIRKAALAFGFFELLEGIAAILERECTMLPGTSHPEATLQLSHAAQELRVLKGYDVSISPLKTDFKHHSR